MSRPLTGSITSAVGGSLGDPPIRLISGTQGLVSPYDWQHQGQFTNIGFGFFIRVWIRFDIGNPPGDNFWHFALDDIDNVVALGTANTGYRGGPITLGFTVTPPVPDGRWRLRYFDVLQLNEGNDIDVFSWGANLIL